MTLDHQQWRDQADDASVAKWMGRVSEIIDTIVITDCGEDSDEHEINTYPASLGVVVLLKAAQDEAWDEAFNVAQAVVASLLPYGYGMRPDGSEVPDQMIEVEALHGAWLALSPQNRPIRGGGV